MLWAEEARSAKSQGRGGLVHFEPQKDQCGWRAGKERIVSPERGEPGNGMDFNLRVMEATRRF